MTNLTDEYIEYIATSLVDCSLPKPEWTHKAHFAAALWLLNDPNTDPFISMPEIIRRYNEACGVSNTDNDGYHETITLASLRAARHSLQTANPSQRLSATLIDLLASGFGRSDWLLEYWSRECLFSVSARRNWIEPDLKTLPFP